MKQYKTDLQKQETLTRGKEFSQSELPELVLFLQIHSPSSHFLLAEQMQTSPASLFQQHKSMDFLKTHLPSQHFLQN